MTLIHSECKFICLKKGLRKITSQEKRLEVYTSPAGDCPRQLLLQERPYLQNTLNSCAVLPSLLLLQPRSSSYFFVQLGYHVNFLIFWSSLELYFVLCMCIFMYSLQLWIQPTSDWIYCTWKKNVVLNIYRPFFLLLFPPDNTV